MYKNSRNSTWKFFDSYMNHFPREQMDNSAKSKAWCISVRARAWPYVRRNMKCLPVPAYVVCRVPGSRRYINAALKMGDRGAFFLLQFFGNYPPWGLKIPPANATMGNTQWGQDIECCCRYPSAAIPPSISSVPLTTVNEHTYSIMIHKEKQRK